MHPLLSPIIDGFLNDALSPEELAERHKISIREVLDLLLSDDASTILRRLTRAERLRQSVLSARARSKAFATLDYLTLSDRHSHHKDCDSRRRASEAILKQTRPNKPVRRAPAPALPARTSLLLATLEDHSSKSPFALPSPQGAVPTLISTSLVSAPDPLPHSGPAVRRRPSCRRSNQVVNSPANLQSIAGSMNSASYAAQSKRGSPDDGLGDRARAPPRLQFRQRTESRSASFLLRATQHTEPPNS